MSTLPQELLEAIIDCTSDERTLKVCSLVSKQLSFPAQRNLFHTFRLYSQRSRLKRTATETQLGSLNSAAALFRGSPHLALHVRHLTIQFSDLEDEANALEVILESIGNVVRLLVFGANTRWDTLKDGVRRAFLKALTYPSLERLHLLRFSRVPSGLIATIVRIPVLSLYHTLVDANEDAGTYRAAHEAAPKPRLRHLILRDSSLEGTLKMFHILQFLLHPRDEPYTENIRILELRLESRHLGLDEQLLHACAPQLEVLYLDANLLQREIDLPPMPHLRHVSFASLLPVHLPPTITSLLETAPLLQTLTLRISSTHFTGGAYASCVIAEFSANQEFDRALPLVKCILVQNNVFSDREQVWAAFTETMRGIMSGLCAAGKLVCVLEDPPEQYLDHLP